MTKTKFIQTKNTDVYFQRLISEDGKIELGVYPVMFGYRIRAGFVGSFCSEIDWCGGNDQMQVELLYSIAKNILESKGNFNELPICSKIKPFYKDDEFVEFINSMITKPLEIIKLQPLNSYREIMLNKI